MFAPVSARRGLSLPNCFLQRAGVPLRSRCQPQRLLIDAGNHCRRPTSQHSGDEWTHTDGVKVIPVDPWISRHGFFRLRMPDFRSNSAR